MTARRAIRIRVDYDDGSAQFAEGKDAGKIWETLLGHHDLMLRRVGSSYNGPQLTEIPAEGKEKP